MIIKIAWRNIWRNKVRSTVVIASVALGLWAGVFVTSFYKGITAQKIEDVVSLEMSHLQIHAPNFRDEFLSGDTILKAEQIGAEISRDPRVQSVSNRVIAMGMLASPIKSGAIKAVGINVGQETRTTTLTEHLIEGTFFETRTKHPIVISKKLADKYKLKLKSKVVLTVQDINLEIASGAFKVVGIFQSTNGMFDNMNVFVLSDQLSALQGLENSYHEIAILLKDHEDAAVITNEMSSKYSNLEVLSWMDLSTGMRFLVEAMDSYMAIIVGIVLLALLFGIINTMLMSILERTRELGMLLCIGMSKLRVFLMIVYETVILAASGGPIGLFLTWVSVTYFGEHGIDLGPFKEVYMDMGFAPVIYPVIDNSDFVLVSSLVIIMAILASIFPAYKALKLNPVEALRKL